MKVHNSGRFFISLCVFRGVFRGLLMALLMALVSPAVSAEEYAVSRMIFLPAIYHVGDMVELRLSLRSNFSQQEIQAPQNIPQPEWGAIHDIRVVSRDDEQDIRIRFTSFYPGTRTMPPIDLGAIVIGDISIFVTSLLEGTELAVSQGQVIFPGTQIIIMLIAILMFTLPLLGIPMFTWCRRYVRKIVSLYRKRQPYRILEKNLKELTGRASLMDGRNFYIQLLDLVREYLSGRMRQNVKVATTGELETYLRHTLKNPEDRDFIIGLFHHGDLVKFASQPSTLRSRIHHLEQLQEVLDHIEIHYRKHESDEEFSGKAGKTEKAGKTGKAGKAGGLQSAEAWF
ncbi:MAG: hypothetical protein ACR2PY_07320 [Salinispira sp.]